MDHALRTSAVEGRGAEHPCRLTVVEAELGGVCARQVTIDDVETVDGAYFRSLAWLQSSESRIVEGKHVAIGSEILKIDADFNDGVTTALEAKGRCPTTGMSSR